MKVRTGMGRARSAGLAPGACLRLGRAVTTLRCGLAYAGNSIVKGDAQGITMGLDTAAKSAKDVEDLLPAGRSLVRSIKAGASGLIKELRPGKRVSRKTAEQMLVKVRELGTKVDKLNAQSGKNCG